VLSRVSVSFTEKNLVPNAGLLPAAVLAQRIGLGDVIDQRPRLAEHCAAVRLVIERTSRCGCLRVERPAGRVSGGYMQVLHGQQTRATGTRPGTRPGRNHGSNQGALRMRCAGETNRLRALTKDRPQETYARYGLAAFQAQVFETGLVTSS
jgi:hypothetical protein